MSSSIKKIEEKFFKVVMIVCTSIIILCLFSILYTIISKGAEGMSWSMVSQIPQGGFYIGKGGGILNAIIGSLYIAGGATILSLIISLPIVLYMNLYLKRDSKFLAFARTCYDILFGIPSIVYASFGFAIMVMIGLKTSLLAGIIVVTLLILPIMIRTMDEVALLVPKDLGDALYSLGATRWEASKIVMRQIAPGILTAILLSFGRAIGDAACPLFIAGYTDSIPTALSQPTATLPLAIFFQLSSPVQEVQTRAYAAALILTIIILIINGLIRVVNKKLSKHKI
jgi:phosphate transport system permease protein